MHRPDLLFLAHRIPFPPNKGDKIRAHALLCHLGQRHRVHLACFIDDPADMQHRQAAQDIAGGECLFLPLGRRRALLQAALGALGGRPLSQGYFHHGAMQAWATRLVREKNISQAVVFGSAMAPYVFPTGLDPARCILDMVDVDSDKWAQYAGNSAPPKRWIYGWESRRLRHLETAAARAFGHTVLVSPYEAETFRRLAPRTGSIRSIGNGVDLEFFHPANGGASPYPAGQAAIVMTGQMDYWPNIQGAEWFARQVLPLIRWRMPVHFHIVGANPPKGFLRGMENVTVAGRVADMRPYLAHAAVAVAPLLIARGVQNKVLEAMAMSRPMVATSCAIRALDAQPGRDLLVANVAPAFAAAVGDVLAGRAPALPVAGRRYVERHHRWSDTMAEFCRLLDAIAKTPEETMQMQGQAMAGAV